MSRRCASLTLDRLEDLPNPCRSCVFWELDPVARGRAEEQGDTAFEKEAWLSDTLLGWGSSGVVAYVDDYPAGYAMYAPPQSVPRAVAFPTAPVSADAVLLMNVHVIPDFASQGIGRMLVQNVVKDLARRGVRALEAFGSAHADNDPSCVLPVDFLLAVGFKTVRPHARWPRLRLEPHMAVPWKLDVEAALEKLLGAGASLSPTTSSRSSN
jgi:GNAT superfamily N-acetyltransferase